VFLLIMTKNAPATVRRLGIYLQELRGARSNGLFDPGNGMFRLRQHGTLFSCSQKCCTLCNIFVNKKGIFRPAGGESGHSFQMNT
jgi:hypothetical protein